MTTTRNTTNFAFFLLLCFLDLTPAFANSAPTLALQDRVVAVGDELNVILVPTDDDGVVPGLYMVSAPSNASLKDAGNGTRLFSWQPSATGEYSVEFVVEDAQDTQLTNRYKSKILVVNRSEVSALLKTMAGSSKGADVLKVENSISLRSAQPSSEAILLTNVPVSGNGNNEQQLSVESSSNNTITRDELPGVVTKLLSDLPVSTSQTSVQQTPIDSGDGYVYTVNIEHGPNGDTQGYELKTVLRQGRQRTDSSWEWKSAVIEDQTLHNRWHTAPSVAVDKSGRVHVAYNMHNFPWQYKRGENAHDISSMVFRGQQMSLAELQRAATHNRTSFPTLGTAEIPGNQITYPAFYKDNNNDLYVTYRFAAAPKRSFASRQMSSGIAVYNTTTNTWSPIGGAVNHSDGDFEFDGSAPSNAVAFAGKEGWTSYFPKLSFDKQNNLFASVFWREGTAGEFVERPCVVRSNNRVNTTDLKGATVSMPIQPSACGNVGLDNNQQFYNIGSFVLSNNDVPHILLSPENSPRLIASYTEASNSWTYEQAPSGATEIFFDAQNSLYALASGLKIFKRTNNTGAWETIYSEDTRKGCYPKVKKDGSGKQAFIHTQSCDQTTVTIYSLTLP